MAFTSDSSQTNKTLWQTLGISGKIDSLSNFILNPVDPSRNIWALSDAVHIFKCIRNNFLKTGKVLYEGEDVFFKFYQTLNDLEQLNNNLKMCPKLTSTHLSPNSFQKMNARIVFQLFSKSVAEGLNVYRELEPACLMHSEKTEKFTLS